MHTDNADIEEKGAGKLSGDFDLQALLGDPPEQGMSLLRCDSPAPASADIAGAGSV